MGAARLHCPRWLALALSLLLGVFACESALHEAHHLENPQKAEECAVYSAALRVAGLEAALATPGPPRPVPTRRDLDGHAVRALSQAPDGPPPRAPPPLAAA